MVAAALEENTSVGDVVLPSGAVGEGLTCDVAFEQIPEGWEQAVQASGEQTAGKGACTRQEEARPVWLGCVTRRRVLENEDRPDPVGLPRTVALTLRDEAVGADEWHI